MLFNLALTVSVERIIRMRFRLFQKHWNAKKNILFQIQNIPKNL